MWSGGPCSKIARSSGGAFRIFKPAIVRHRDTMRYTSRKYLSRARCLSKGPLGRISAIIQSFVFPWPFCDVPTGSGHKGSCVLKMINRSIGRFVAAFSLVKLDTGSTKVDGGSCKGYTKRGYGSAEYADASIWGEMQGPIGSERPLLQAGLGK